MAKTETETCAACCKNRPNLKQCSACKAVKYCTASCQRRDWKDHKQICPKLSEIKEVLSCVKEDTMRWEPQNDCPICMLPLPHDGRNTTYLACCGQMTCGACMVQIQQMEKSKAGLSEKASILEMAANIHCSFCRQPSAATTEQLTKQLYSHIKKGDPRAMETLAGRYLRGWGVPESDRAAFLLLEKATAVGHPSSARMMGQFYENEEGGVAKNILKAKELYMQGAEAGNSLARRQLGEFEARHDNYPMAVEHFKIAAAAGDDGSLNHLKECHRCGLVSEADLMEATAACKAAKELIESGARKQIDPEYRKVFDNPYVQQMVKSKCI